MKRLVALILVLVLAFALTSCGGGGKSDAKKYKIGVIYTANSAFWTSVGDGAAAKAEELNKTGKYNITTYATGPAESGTSAQVALFEDFLSQGYDGIIVAVSDPATLTNKINEAMDKGIMVVTMDTDAPDSKRLCFVGTDNYNYGVLQGETCVEVMGNKGKLIVFNAFPETLGQAQRTKGIQDAIAAAGNKIELIYSTFTGQIDLLTMCEDAWTHYSDADCCVMTYAAGEQVANVFREKGWTKADKHAVLADDLDPIILSIKDGTCDCSCVQGQYQWGYVGCQVVVDALDGKMPDSDFIETAAFVCDASNVEEKYPNVKPAS
ncbi:MAG: substrate-binding domain-containing protein [Oscillospiraceae bacterium]|nr:substrate-binding domain-containing protein [Oscillospiraceae bacterium]